MTLPTREQCNGWTDVRDAPWLYSYYRGTEQRRAPVPTLHLAYASLRRKRLLKMWLARYGERAVWQFLRYRTALERVV